MGIRDSFANWSLRQQIQVVFILTGFFLTALLIIITKFQLEWLHDSMKSSSTSLLKNSVLAKMSILGSSKANYIALEFNNYIKLDKTLRDFDRAILGFNGTIKNPVSQGTPLQSTSIAVGTKNYTSGAFFSKNELSALGTSLEQTDSAMDQLYPIMRNTKILNLYQGYQQDEIIHMYPGVNYADSSYTPLVREWYYKAENDPTHTIITEPFIDQSSND